MKSNFKISLTKFILLITFLVSASSLDIYSEQTKNGKNFRDSVSVISFSVVGDLMCHSPQFTYAATDSGYDFSNNFKIIKHYLNKADFTIGNLETTLAGKKRGYSGYPLFNTPDEYLDGIKEAGFDFLVTANNHSLDKGEKGLLRTIEKIDKAGLKHGGTFTSKRERDSIQVFTKNGISSTVLSYSYGTNGIPLPKGKEYLVNLIDTTLIKSDISSAKERGIDLILVYYHFGDEYSKEPSAFQQAMVEKTVEFGADIIIGSHPHVPQPVEFFKTKNANLDSGFVAYSLGNFISNQRWRYSDGGPILNFSIVKDHSRDSIYVNEITVIPTWVFKGKYKDDLQYIILPSDSLLTSEQFPFLTEEDRALYLQNYSDIREIMSRRSNKVKFHSPFKSLNSFIENFPIARYQY